MALLSGNRIAWLYTDDEGVQWRVAAQAALVSQAKLGGSAAGASDPERPNWFQMRRVTVSDGLGHSRVLVCYEPGAPIVTKGETINANSLGDSHSLTSNGGFIPEARPRQNVTKQTT